MGIVSNAVDVIEARKAAIGDGTEVRRLLPQRTLRPVREDFEYGVVAVPVPLKPR